MEFTVKKQCLPDLFVKFFKESGHKLKSLFPHPAPCGGQHGIGQVAQLDQIFPVSGIFNAVRFPCQSLFCSVVDPGTAGTGKEKSSPQSHCPQRVQFISVKEHLTFRGAGLDPVPVTVGADSFRDCLAEFKGKPLLLQKLKGDLRSSSGMAYFAL